MIKKLPAGWIPFELIPETIIDAVTKANGFRYSGDWSFGAQNDKGQWVLVTNDGHYYKVGASWSVWHNQGEDVGMQCIWSVAALKRTLKSLMEKGTTIPDPGYRS